MNLPLNIDFQQILLHLLNFVILAGGLYLLLYKPVNKFITEKLVKETKPQTKAQQRYSRLTGDANRPNGRVERVQRTAKMECNLLGLTVDEALPEVDSFIDRAILNGQTVVYLIHGNGTGALRTAIHKHLRGNRMVKSFRLGRYGEGESGVTVVELK